MKIVMNPLWKTVYNGLLRWVEWCTIVNLSLLGGSCGTIMSSRPIGLYRKFQATLGYKKRFCLKKGVGGGWECSSVSTCMHETLDWISSTAHTKSIRWENGTSSSFEFCALDNVLQMRSLPINQEGGKSELFPRGLGAEKREPSEGMCNNRSLPGRWAFYSQSDFQTGAWFSRKQQSYF